MILFGVFFIGPMVYSFRISFFDWRIVHPDQSLWVGLANYLKAIQDPIFQRAVLNTLTYTVLTVTFKMVLGLIVAMLLNQGIKARGFFRVAYYLPVITSWVIVSLLFEYLFSGQSGLVNYILRDILHLIQDNIRWLADEYLALVPVILVDIWKGVGWSAIILLAGLQIIPKELYEAAKVDGANGINSFFGITIPLMRPTLVFLLVVLIIGGLNAYIPFLLITGGDPLDRTHSILTLMYEATFGRMRFGYGAAISYLLTIFVFIISWIELRLLRKPVEW
jgi:multiple sugar transport system permease protein